MDRTSPLPALAIAAAAALGAATAACKAPQAYGERNHVVVRADSALWSRYEDLIEAALEPRIYTVRPERTFEITAVEPGHPQWNRLREWQQVLVLGTPHDPIVRDLFRKADARPEPWALAQAENVWARGQLVTALALPPDPHPDSLRAHLEALHRRLDTQYREWVRQRMFASGANDSLADALAARGFRLVLPNVYRVLSDDSIFRFKNPYPDPGTLQRSLLVTWIADGGLPTATALEAWRREAGGRYYDPPQDVLAEGLRFDTLETGGRTALEMRGVWQDRAEFPAAGPFIARAVPCPEQQRVYYMDAWVYAPNQEKYPYVIQMETLLDSFRCARGER
jgi:hypothetical protein